MSAMRVFPMIVLVSLGPTSSPPPPATAECSHLPVSNAPAALTNDNRTPAGTLTSNVLTLRLVVQEARWYPEGEQGCGIGMFAFAEEGKPARIPGPLIRVPEGTEVRVAVRNATAQLLLIRGLQDRSRDSIVTRQQIEIGPGETHDFAYRATTAGTWYYHAMGPGNEGATFVPASPLYSQAVGALIVDSPGGQPRDRVFIMTRWRGPATSAARNQGWELTAFNGRSWPHTERITAVVGDTVRWRVIAANNDGHAMHLHGFYFQVVSNGNLVRETVHADSTSRLRVTEPLAPGGTMVLRWAPERPGNWIFHCHLVRHMSGSQRLDRMPDAATTGSLSTDPAHASHAMHEMAGLVMGISVRPSPRAPTAATAGASPRTLRLFANQRNAVFGNRTGYSFVIQEGTNPPAPDSIRIPGTAILLTRGQPVQINVLNRLRQPLSVHWHGIELESWYDGVAGWSGAGGSIAPPVAPGDSFVVRFTPPRAGTFIYHVHNEAGEELPAGLYGALMVLEPGYDAAQDRVLVVSEAGPGQPPLGQEPLPPFVNGNTKPDTMDMVMGRTYRMRFVIIPANDHYLVALRRGAQVEQWRRLARDGAEATGSTGLVPAQLSDVGAGMTMDYAFTPTAPGDLVVAVDPIGPPRGQPIGNPTRVPIRVRAPR